MPSPDRLSTQNSSTAIRRLGLGHFAFYRAYLEGSAEIDLPTLAETYLNWGRDPRQVALLLRWLQDELANAARRINDREAIRLLRLPRAIGKAVSQARNGTSQESDLDRFAAEVDPDGVYSEQELITLYSQTLKDKVNNNREHRKASQAARLRERRLVALKRLESAVAEAPRIRHTLAGWIEPNVAARLESVGVVSVGQLIDWIEMHGSRWHTRVPKVGGKGAMRLVCWLANHAESLKRTIDPRALIPAGQRDNAALLRARADASETGDFPPLEALTLPAVLSGEHGTYRAAPVRCKIAACTDLDAVLIWLNRHPNGSDTYRSYRVHVERLLLWCIRHRGKALSGLDADDIAQYEIFLATPDAEWIRASRHIRRWQSGWRPFDGPLSASSIATSIAVLKSLFNWLVKVRYLEESPWDRADPDLAYAGRASKKAAHVELLAAPVQSPTTLPRQEEQQRGFTEKEWEVLTNHLARQTPTLANERIRFALLLGEATGWRVSELAAAKIGDIVEISRGTKGGSEWVVQRRGKVWASLTSEFMKVLERYLRSRGLPVDPRECDPECALIGSLAEDDGVCHAHLDRMWLSRLISNALSEAGKQIEKRQPKIGGRVARATAQWLGGKRRVG